MDFKDEYDIKGGLTLDGKVNSYKLFSPEMHSSVRSRSRSLSYRG
jgi:hypothetical protein